MPSHPVTRSSSEPNPRNNEPDGDTPRQMPFNYEQPSNCLMTTIRSECWFPTTCTNRQPLELPVAVPFRILPNKRHAWCDKNAGSCSSNKWTRALCTTIDLDSRSNPIFRTFNNNQAIFVVVPGSSPQESAYFKRVGPTYLERELEQLRLLLLSH